MIIYDRMKFSECWRPQVWKVVEQERTGASLSPNGAYIAISDLSTGFEIYEMDTELVYGSFQHDVGEPFPTPVLFIHNGNALVGGSTVGNVNIWDVHGMGKMHSLTISSTRALPRTSKRPFNFCFQSVLKSWLWRY